MIYKFSSVIRFCKKEQYKNIEAKYSWDKKDIVIDSLKDEDIKKLIEESKKDFMIEEKLKQDPNLFIDYIGFSVKKIASDSRKIIVMQGFDEENINFISELNNPKLFVHPDTKKNYLFIVENGFSDLKLLKLKYLEFLNDLITDIVNKDENFSRTIKYTGDKKLIEGSINNQFSFVYENIRWDVYNKITQEVKSSTKI